MAARDRLSRERVILPTQPPSNPIDGDMYWDPAANPSAGGNPPTLFVGPDNPEMAGPGLWVQTGLGEDGTGITLWIEDGL